MYTILDLEYTFLIVLILFLVKYTTEIDEVDFAKKSFTFPLSSEEFKVLT